MCLRYDDPQQKLQALLESESVLGKFVEAVGCSCPGHAPEATELWPLRSSWWRRGCHLPPNPLPETEHYISRLQRGRRAGALAPHPRQG